jgi:UDP-N-acetylglucosamine--N-acetylmuramyl-(pentapeptide) pyrophosphoryl-undecaprenol N-acetylglucosamine transferase
MDRPTYIIAGGGTGGHMYPGLAVADQLTRQDPDSLVVFACSSRPIDRRILDETDYAIVPQPTRPLRRNPVKIPGFLWAWHRSLKIARRMLDDLRPRAVLGLGGFAAGAPVREAAARSIPTAMLNPDIVPGKANRYLAKRVEVIFVQFESTRDCFAPEIRDRVRVVGCPTRPHLLEGSRDEAFEYFDLYPDRKTLLVFGGSILAESITDTICILAEDMDEFAEKWQVLMFVGAQKLDAARQVFNNRAIRATVLEYCDRMDLAYAITNLAVCRGGAGTVAELSATATPAVVLPYPYHSDRQQYLNIEERVEAGCALLVEDRGVPSINADELRPQLLPILREPSRLESMKSAAKSTSRSRAAAEVAEWMATR